MSTRSVVTVIDKYHAFHIYRHCDGYPGHGSGVIPTLAEALPFAWPLPRFEAMDFAAALVRAWKQEGGGNIYFTAGPDLHGDLEYRYEIRCEDRTLHVKVFAVSGPDGKTSTLQFDGTLADAETRYAEKVTA